MIKTNNNITAHCHFDRSDAKHRGAEKSIKINKFLGSLCSLGMTRRRALTLPEMTVVITIAALMVALTIPAANMLLNSFESESGAKSIINAALASARSIAIKEQRYAGIRFQKRYDPSNPDPISAPQYMIFIINEEPAKMGGLTIGFRAVNGVQPIKLPDSIGIMDLLYDPKDTTPPGDGQVNTHSEIANSNIFRDTTTFSIIFSPSGKLVIHNVCVRNRDGETQGTESASVWGRSQDDVFNTLSRITNPVNPVGMFLQDDYFADYSGSPVINLGLGPEMSRNSFIIYETKKFNQAYNNGNALTGYLNQLKPVYINPYTGTTVSEK